MDSIGAQGVFQHFAPPFAVGGQDEFSVEVAGEFGRAVFTADRGHRRRRRAAGVALQSRGRKLFHFQIKALHRKKQLGGRNGRAPLINAGHFLPQPRLMQKGLHLRVRVLMKKHAAVRRQIIEQPRGFGFGKKQRQHIFGAGGRLSVAGFF